MEIRRHICFHGHVQGVGFRYTAVHLARAMGLTGWVRNEYDGTVTMEVQGRDYLVDELLRRLYTDRYISIDRTESDVRPLEQERGFSVR